MMVIHSGPGRFTLAVGTNENHEVFLAVSMARKGDSWNRKTGRSIALQRLRGVINAPAEARPRPPMNRVRKFAEKADVDVKTWLKQNGPFLPTGTIKVGALSQGESLSSHVFGPIANIVRKMGTPIPSRDKLDSGRETRLTRQEWLNVTAKLASQHLGRRHRRFDTLLGVLASKTKLNPVTLTPA